jgi:spermidine synthase
MLQIGLGTGALASALHGQRLVIDAVEIDPSVVRFAREYFGFQPTGTVYEEDARTFLGRAGPRYDIVVHDTFTGGTTPEHLLSREVLERVRDRLRPGGVLVLNFAGFVRGPGAEATWAVASTLRAAFANVRAFGDEPLEERADEGRNVIFFASDAPLAFAIPDVLHAENATCKRVLRSFQSWELPALPQGPVITDARNPLARLQLPVAEEHYEAMNKLLPPEVWLP